MDLRHLRSFVTIADAGGFARAAARLNVSQPALSRQIQAFETSLDVPLFDRRGRRIQLTPEGEDLLQRSRRLLTDAESLGERARALKGGQTGVLRVGATPQAIETLLAPFLTRYRRGHPGVEVHLIEDGGVRLPHRLERGDVHLALMAGGDGRFHGRLLFPLYVLAIMPRAHRLTRRATLEIAELADEPLLLPRRDFRSRQWFDAASQLAHIQPRLLLESGAPDTLVALARAGYGVAVVPSNVPIPPRGVCAVPLVQRGVSIDGWLSIVWDPRRFLAPYAERFAEELVVHSRHGYPGRSLTRRAPRLPRPKETTASGAMLAPRARETRRTRVGGSA
jgi:DNA-binding transcriptional LysR family regulator